MAFTLRLDPNMNSNQPVSTTSPSAVARWSARLWNFIGSMRFAVSILTLVAIASAIGTIIKQNESKLGYVDQFGSFWAGIFQMLGLFDVYNQAWFLVMLVFLLASTGICLIRNTPKMLRDMRQFKLHQRTHSLLHLPEHGEFRSSLPTDALIVRAAQMFERLGYQTRASQTVENGQTRVYFAAKRGGLSRLGYILTHLAIVVICLGGLLDSDLSIRAQVWLFGKTPISNVTAYKNVPESGILSDHTLSYRGNIRIPEGKSADFVELTYGQNAYLLQDLPFWVRLDKFIVEYYSTGMPKRFASEVTIKDKNTGKDLFTQTISVNHPLRYKGVALYQANFDANDSLMQLKVHPLFGVGKAFKSITAQAGGQSEFPFGDKAYHLEWREFKPTNVFPTNDATQNKATAWSRAMNPKGDTKEFQNFGASVRYILRDDAGNANEYIQYASPVMIEGISTFLTAQRGSLDADYNYFHIPADDENTIDDFMRLRAVLADADGRKQVAQRYAAQYAQQNGQMSVSHDQLVMGFERTLGELSQLGLDGIGQQIEATVPAAERDKIATSIAHVLEGNLWQALNMARENEHLPARTWDENHQKFIRAAMYSLSEYRHFGSPVWVELTSFDIKQASGLQATRSPGQWWVYLGSLMLVLGVLAMVFIRERRVWLHITPAENGGQHLTVAMSSTRRTYDYHRHWQILQDELRRLISSVAP